MRVLLRRRLQGGQSPEDLFGTPLSCLLVKCRFATGHPRLNAKIPGLKAIQLGESLYLNDGRAS